MKWFMVFNYNSSLSSRLRGCAIIKNKKSMETYPKEETEKLFLSGNIKYHRLGKWGIERLNEMDMTGEKDFGKIYIDKSTPSNFIALFTADDFPSLTKRQEIMLVILKKYSKKSKVPHLLDLAERIEEMQSDVNFDIEIDDDFNGFFNGEEKHGFICRFVQ